MQSEKYLLVAAVAFALGGCREPAGDDDGVTFDAGVIDAMPGDADLGPHPGELWVAGWNLQTFPKAVSTVAHLAQVLPTLNADVIGVEEIQDLTEFARLDELLPDYVGLTASNGDGFSRVGLIYRSATVTIDDPQTLFLGDGSAFPRPPLSVHVSSQGIDLQVIVLHLKASGDDASVARRRDAINKLNTYLQAQLASAPERQFLLLGDWNDELTDPVADNVFQPLLSNTTDYTFLTLPLAEMPAEGTFIPFAGSFIDHMLLTRNALDVWGSGTTSVLHLDDGDVQYQSTISDHRPILTKFRPAP